MIRLQETRSVLLLIAICISVINDIRVALCHSGNLFPASLQAIVETASLMEEGRPNVYSRNNLNGQDDEEPFYTEDECFIAGNGMTKYRFPTKTFNTKVIPHSKKKPSFVVGVLSTAHRPHDRTKIRESWALGHDNVFFLVGGNWTNELELEFKEYNDLIYVDSPEHYRLITTKVLAFMQAANKHLPNAMVVKTDDDSYVRMTEMAYTAEKNRKKSFYKGGGCKPDAIVAREHPSWYVNRTLYEPDVYPPYAYGGGYLLSADVNQCALQAMEKRTSDNQVFPIEDAFIGILLQEGCPKVKCETDKSDWRRYMTGSIVDVSGRQSRVIKGRIIVHQIKSYELMLMMHEDACCRRYRAEFPIDPVSCVNMQCPERFTQHYHKVKHDFDPRKFSRKKSQSKTSKTT